MVNSPVKTEPTLLETVDFRAFLATLRVRWWVIPATLAATVGLLVAQESRLRDEPAAYLITKTYATPDPKALLNQIGINPETVKELPDAASQLAMLRSDRLKQEVTEQIGEDVYVETPRGFESPTGFICESSDISACDAAIDAYAIKFAEIRREAIVTGLTQLRNVFAEIQSTLADQTAAVKAAGIDGLIRDINTDLVLVDRIETPIGTTVTTVSTRKYVFGLAAGSLLSLLILLQLTYSDSRVRSLKQLTRLIGEENILGSVPFKHDDLRSRRAAISLMGNMSSVNGSTVRFIPLRSGLADISPLSGVADLAGVTYSVSAPFSEMSVPEFTRQQAGEVDVVVIVRNRDLRKDVVDVLAASRYSARHLAGVLLVG